MTKAAALWGVMAIALAASNARADDCGAIAERGQVERKDGRLLAAKASFDACARAECAPEIREFCARWLADTDHVLPSIVVSLSQDGREIVQATLGVDGRRVRDSLGVDALPLDPGKHHVAVESAKGSIEADVVLREGEKAKVVALVLPPTHAPLPPPSPEAPSRFTAGVVGLGTVGLVAAGTSLGFVIAALVDKNNLSLKCGQDPTKCTSSDRATGKAFEIVTEVSAGVALVALGAATFLALRPAPAQPARAAVAPGALLGLDARF